MASASHRPDRPRLETGGGPMSMTNERTVPSSGFYGSVSARDEYAGFALTRLVHSRGIHLPLHSHAHAYFTLLRSGGYWESFGRTQVTYPVRSVHFHRPGIIHRDVIAPGGASFLVVEIGEDLLRRAVHDLPLPAGRWDDHGGELAQAAWRLERECFDPERRSPLVLEGLVLEMLGLVPRAPDNDAKKPAWLAQVIERLHDHLDQRVTLQQLAREAGVHPVRLARAFRRHVGVGVGEYVRAERVRWIEERLAHGDEELAQLALDAGFVDQSHMTRAFRRVTGRTPGEVRAEARRAR